MTNRFCHAGLCTALALLILSGPARGEQTPDLATSCRNTQRTQVVDRAMRSAVNIHTEKRQKSVDAVFTGGRANKINGMGTGIVIDERGYIVTNHHVVQDVERLRVTTCDGMEYEANVLAFDARQDLAIIKIATREPMTVATFGTSSDLMLGEDVIAIGNAYGYESTVTRGIISCKSRDVEVNEEQAYKNLIQIDAAINPGNSGGPLINADGEVIGINVAIRAGAQRIGFAIPIDDARLTIARLMNIERHHQTWHGITSADLKQGRNRKLVIQFIRPDSPAGLCGLRKGDVILKSDSVDIVDGADFERSLFGKSAGTEVSLVVLRDGERVPLSMRLATLMPSRSQGISSLAQSQESSRSMSTEKAWELLGLKLSKVDGQLPVAGQPYKGGMRVVSVRGQSPAEINGIQQGDILVGLHVWETINDENVNYMLNHPQLTSLGPLKFYIVRNGETLFGHFRLSAIAQR